MENKNLIDKAIGFIQKHPKENLSLQSIADSAGFSINYFDTIFRAHTGYSPVEYSRIYKLTRSAIELRRTKKTVLDIALDFGYTSPESYSRAFKKFYSITPSEYREKYSRDAVTWHDLSGKIAISHFRRDFPEFIVSDIDFALDFCFTHNPIKYAEDIVAMSVTETAVFTLGNSQTLEHFIYVSDYNSFEPVITIVSETEEDAISYLNLLSRSPNLRFSIRRNIDDKWEQFEDKIAKLGLICRYGYDMIYNGELVKIPKYENLSVRPLTADDMSYLKEFKQNGGCLDCHIKAIQLYFDEKGNSAMRPVGVFGENKLVCIAIPTLDTIRDLYKYDIGAIFTVGSVKDNIIELIWKYVIDMCLRENANIGNGNAYEDDSSIGVIWSERVGLNKVAMVCSYSK